MNVELNPTITVKTQIQMMDDKHHHDEYVILVSAWYGTSYFNFEVDIDYRKSSVTIVDVVGEAGLDLDHSRPVGHDDSAYNLFMEDELFGAKLPYIEYVPYGKAIGILPNGQPTLLYIATDIMPVLTEDEITKVKLKYGD